jgi:hypothetical protein
MHNLFKIEDKLGLRFFKGGGGGNAPAVPKPPAPTAAAGNTNANTLANGRRRSGFASTFLSSIGGVTNQQVGKTILGG